ncbi:hypothetical protein ACFO0A_00050 [Novosphingobium tardum]|uniref:Tail assembly chaperone n=1 Tax=Novosphingobium tardum TaxID=1538021 RepID=A0ABV8RJJ8_9SPHN
MTAGPGSEAGAAPIKIRLKPAMRARWDLPDIGYPLTFEHFAAALDGDGELPFAVMLSLLQKRSAAAGSDWQTLEPALKRLAEIVTPAEDRDVVSALTIAA